MSFISHPDFLDPVYDDGGQMTDDGRRWLYVYDAFGRLVQVKDKSNSNALVCEYEYDALGQRVRAWHDTDADTTQDADEWECLVYDDRWRLVTVYKETSTDPIPFELNVPHNAGFDGFGGSSYIDSWALRERDKNLDETLETRAYYIQNWRADVISELTDALSTWTYSGSVRYSAYGEHEFLTLGDVSDKTPVALRDGVLTSEDSSQISTWYGASNLAGDLDDANESGVPDGAVTIDDVIFEATLYSIDGLVPDEPRFLYAGYVHDPVIGSAASALPSGTGSGIYHVRNRVYNPELGRWTKRDPIGYVDGVSLIEYSLCSPIMLNDPEGTWVLPALLAGAGCVLGYELYELYRAADAYIEASDSAIKACTSEVNYAMTKDPATLAVRNEMTGLGCKAPKITCKKCGGNGNDTGKTDQKTGDITICVDASRIGLSYTRITVTHELIHARQNCSRNGPSRRGPNSQSCVELIADEREAIERSGQCCRNSPFRNSPPPGFSPSWSYEECVREYTKQSTETASCYVASTFDGDFNAAGSRNRTPYAKCKK